MFVRSFELEKDDFGCYLEGKASKTKDGSKQISKEEAVDNPG